MILPAAVSYSSTTPTVLLRSELSGYVLVHTRTIEERNNGGIETHLTRVMACPVASMLVAAPTHPEHTSQPPSHSPFPPCSPKASAIIFLRQVAMALAEQKTKNRG